MQKQDHVNMVKSGTSWNFVGFVEIGDTADKLEQLSV